jgi:simple sugar transport system ATP-binding protein
MDLALEMHDITKRYQQSDLPANDAVDFDLRKGEIHCIAGENGAGKTTLMKILYGMEKPDSGTICVRGRDVKIGSPLIANRLKIGMVHQHFMLVEEFTVAQNVVMGVEPRRGRFGFDRKKAERTVSDAIALHGFSIEAGRLVKELTQGQKQQVEILKMLYRDIEILILDEPTAILAEQEIVSLFKTLKALVDVGKSIVLITHKLQEVKRFSDRVTVLRKGRKVGTFATDTIDERSLSCLMMGKELSAQRAKCISRSVRKEILSFDSVTVRRPSQEQPLLDNVSFSAYSHEIVGFVGVGKNELGVLESVLGGMRKISSGTVRHLGEDITNMEPNQLRRKGMSYVPADRMMVGSSLSSSVKENLIVTSIDAYARHGWLNDSRVQLYTKQQIDAYSVDGSPSQDLGSLSGGNIQKVILAREIAHPHDYLILSEPTWGLDVASSQYVYEKVERMCELGSAVLLLSSNLDEVLSLANRLVVFHQGAIAAVFEENEMQTLTKSELGQYMLGIKRQAIDG